VPTIALFVHQKEREEREEFDEQSSCVLGAQTIGQVLHWLVSLYSWLEGMSVWDWEAAHFPNAHPLKL
jgi:hypothetical protein